MKSRITIDFKGVDAVKESQQFKPVIRVSIEDSDDVRDGLVSAFFEALGHQSNWLVADIHTETFNGTTKKFATISPVEPSELQETINLIEKRIVREASPKINESELPSRFQIGDGADYTTSEWIDIAFDKAKEKNSKVKLPLIEEDLDYIPHYSFGKVVAIKFTEGKVWYDILDDFTGKVVEGIDSCYIKNFSDATRAIIQQEQKTK